MKKQTIVLVLVAVIMALTPVVGNSQSKRAKRKAEKLSGVPSFVNDAYLKASEDVIVGIGAYKIGNDLSRISTGKTFAETRALAQIARQLKVIIEDMVTDFTAQSELDPTAAKSFQEIITRNLSKATLQGARVIKMDTLNGVLWVVMEYSKSPAANDFSAAQAAAKLDVPQAEAFDALSRMDEAFYKTAGGGPASDEY